VEDFVFGNEETGVRQGARQTIELGSGVDEDFADVFVATARAAGIPARRVVGWHNESADVGLHVWAEWYDHDSQVWRRTNPTLGNATGRDYFDYFDLFHFALVRNGYFGSELPTPPVSVSVNFIDGEATPSATLEIPQLELRMRQLGFLPLPGFYDLVITNLQGNTVPDLELRLTADSNEVVASNPRGNSVTLLPFQTQTLALSVYNRSWLRFWQVGDLTASLHDGSGNIYVTTTQNIISFSFIGLGGGAACFAFAFTAWSILVARRKK
jgi:hypothetical protein